jgi:hypothetical protein
MAHAQTLVAVAVQQAAVIVKLAMLTTAQVMATAVQSHGSVMVLRIVKTRHTAVT